MKYSSNIIKKYISVSVSPEHIANELTLRTCEIENVQKRETPSSVVIGKVTKVEKHPNADTLRVCQVNCGSHGTYQICTGGENIKENIYVPVALPGTHLPIIDITIESRKLRGVESSGMICSKGELGINEDEEKHWIRILQHEKPLQEDDIKDINDKKLGASLTQELPRIDNVIFEVDNKTVTHRPDLTGHFGLACELNAIYRTHYPQDLTFENTSSLLEQISATPLVQMLQSSRQSEQKIQIKSDLVYSYLAISIPHIQINTSSLYTRCGLLDLGSTPRNNWVDFGNMFMHVTGQPIHCFDADKIRGDIIVQQLDKDEEFVDLMGQKHLLKKGDLAICDEEKVIALAGIIGGQNTAITQSTKNILIEVGNFDGVHIRRTALRLNLRTDAAMRFEKSINPIYSLQMIHWILDELKYHKSDLGECEIKGISYWYSSAVEQMISAPNKIHMNYEKMNERIYGYVNLEAMGMSKKLLTHLGYTIHEQNESDRDVQTPWLRAPHDITLSEDIMEECARIIGYNTIIPQKLFFEASPKKIESEASNQRICEDILVQSFGYQQLETYPRCDIKGFENYTSPQRLLLLKNPLSPENKYLRDSMLYNLFKHTEKNVPFFEEVSCFDIGKIRFYDEEKHGTQRLHYPTNLQEHMSLGMMYSTSKINTRQQDPTLIQKKQIVLLLKKLLHGEGIYFESDNHPGYHPKKYAKILIGKERKQVGYLGQLHPYFLSKNKFEEKKCVSYAQLDLSMIESLQQQKENNFSSHMGYETLQDQIIYRDLSFVVDTNISFESLLQTTKNINDIEHVDIFDIYQGDQLSKDKKSISFSIKIKGDGAMTTEKINEIMETVINKASQTGAILRKDF